MSVGGEKFRLVRLYCTVTLLSALLKPCSWQRPHAFLIQVMHGDRIFPFALEINFFSFQVMFSLTRKVLLDVYTYKYIYTNP